MGWASQRGLHRRPTSYSRAANGTGSPLTCTFLFAAEFLLNASAVTRLLTNYIFRCLFLQHYSELHKHFPGTGKVAILVSS